MFDQNTLLTVSSGLTTRMRCDLRRIEPKNFSSGEIMMGTFMYGVLYSTGDNKCLKPESGSIMGTGACETFILGSCFPGPLLKFKREISMFFYKHNVYKHIEAQSSKNVSIS